jgi:predicted metal-dependent hydrolase
VHSLELNGQKISYEIRPSRRARRLGLTVYPGGRLVVTMPVSSTEDPEGFIQRHALWVQQSMRRQAGKKRLPGGVKDYRENRMSAHQLVSERIKHFNTIYRFKIGKVTIRNTKSRWGSCSRNGNLSFSYKLVHLSPELVDYIIVHELCHLKEFNHSERFWKLVGKTIPQYKSLRHALRAFIH